MPPSLTFLTLLAHDAFHTSCLSPFNSAVIPLLPHGGGLLGAELGGPPCLLCVFMNRYGNGGCGGNEQPRLVLSPRPASSSWLWDLSPDHCPRSIPPGREEAEAVSHKRPCTASGCWNPLSTGFSSPQGPHCCSHGLGGQSTPGSGVLATTPKPSLKCPLQLAAQGLQPWRPALSVCTLCIVLSIPIPVPLPPPSPHQTHRPVPALLSLLHYSTLYKLHT